jgi:hypothetical protein
MASFVTLQEKFALGLGAEAFVAASRPISAVSIAANTLTLPGHGLEEDAPFRLESTGTLPAPLVPGVVYYAAPVAGSIDLLQVRAAPGGAAIDLADEGSEDGIHALIADPTPKILAMIEAVSGDYEQALHAHKLPLSVVPIHLKKAVVSEVDDELTTVVGLVRPNYRDPSIPARAAEARRFRARLQKGEPLRGAVDASPTVAESGATSWGDDDTGWNSTPGVL